MTLNPLWLQNLSYPARIDRVIFDSIWSEGIFKPNDFKVTQSGTPGMSVQVAAGTATVTGDDQVEQGKYLVRSDASVTGVTISVAPGTGQRNDLIVLKVRDSNAGVGVDDDAIIQVVAGTASLTPVDPAVPDTALVLARVRVPAGTSSITNSLIDDLRQTAYIVPLETIAVAISDEITPLTTGTAKVTFRMPFAMTVTQVRASLTAASTSGIPTFDINESGSSILSTKLTIDANELTSTTATTPAVISDSSLADDAQITIDIDVAGTGAKGAKIYILGSRA